MTIKTVAIYTEPNQQFASNSYLLYHLSQKWQNAGLNIEIVDDPALFAKANIAILHVNLTRVPVSYLSLMGRYRAAINKHVDDISKRSLWPSSASNLLLIRSNEMKVDVYHLNRDTANKNAMISKLVDQFGKTLDDLATVASFVKGWLPANDGYNYVATVECYNIGDVFKLTNHIRSPWMNNEEIIQVTAPARRHRSTSVGDLYIVRDEAG